MQASPRPLCYTQAHAMSTQSHTSSPPRTLPQVSNDPWTRHRGTHKRRGCLGYAVTGGQDTIINVFSLANTTGEPNFSLIGHTDNVCALDTTPDGTIISGSWDRYVILNRTL